MVTGNFLNILLKLHMTFSIGWNMLWTDWPFSAIGKNMIFWRKIVIFHTKYPNNFRAFLRSAQFFLSAPPHPPNLKSWIHPCFSIFNLFLSKLILAILFRLFSLLVPWDSDLIWLSKYLLSPCKKFWLCTVLYNRFIHLR